MSSQPECQKCGYYVYHGKCLCADYMEKILTKIESLERERDEALQLAEGSSTLKELAALCHERGVEVERLREALEEARRKATIYQKSNEAMRRVRENGLYVPGVWTCDVCGFVLYRAGSGEAVNEVCPNDEQVMRPQSWQERAEEAQRVAVDLGKAAEAAEADVKRFREALSDLVSWIPDVPTKPKWCLDAGKWGADDAIEYAREVLDSEQEDV